MTADAPPGYVYDGGWRALGPTGERTEPYTCLEAAARARDRGAFEDPDAAPVGWYPIPPGQRPVTCKSCGQASVCTRTDGKRAMPLSLKEVRTYGGRKHAASHFSDCPDARGWSTAKRGTPQPKTSNRPAGRAARPAGFSEDER